MKNRRADGRRKMRRGERTRLSKEKGRKERGREEREGRKGIEGEERGRSSAIADGPCNVRDPTG